MSEILTSIKSDLQQLVSGTTLSFIGAVLASGFMYLYGVMFARCFGPEKLGLFFLGLITLQILSAICRVGLPEGLLRFVAVHNGNEDSSRVKGTILSAVFISGITSIFIGILFYVCARPLSIHLFKQPYLPYYLRWFAVTLPLFSIFILVVNAIQALKRMDIVVISRDFLQPVAMFILALTFLYFFRDPLSFLAGYFGSVIIALVVSVYLLKRVCPALDKQTSAIFEWKTLLLFSLPITGGDIAHYLFRWSDTFLLSIFRASAEVGVYNAALRTTLLLNVLASSVNALYAPIIADHHHHGRYQDIEVILKTIVRWCLTLALPLVLAIAFLSKDILLLWGQRFTGGTTAMVILAVSQLIFLPSCLLAFTLLMCGKQYIELFNTVLLCVTNIAMNLFLIPKHGITGAAISMVISQSLALILRWAQVHLILGIPLYTAKYFKPFMALFLISAFFFPLKGPLMEIISNVLMGFHLGAMALTFFLILISYLLILYVMGFEKEDLLVWKELQFRKTATVSDR